jgi:hypothetical protein
MKALRSGVNPANLAFSAVLLAGCADRQSHEGSNPDPNRAATSETTALPDEAFARPWVFIDRLKFDHPFDAMLSTPFGFVALSHAPTPDGRAMPPINNIVALSRDGLTWEENTLGATIHGRALAWGNGVLVAMGRHRGAAAPAGAILVSGDGRQWELVASPAQSLMAVSFAQGRFWAFGEFGAFWTSTDGRTWRDQSRPQSVQFNDVAFGNGRYVVVGNVSWLSSADGETWTEHRSICDDLLRCPGVVPPGGSPPGALALFSVLFGKGLFVTQGGVGGWVSADGLAWTEAPGVVGNGSFSLGRFVAIAPRSGEVVVSDDGRSWSSRTSYLVSDEPLGCDGRVCLVVNDGILVVPNPTDSMPLPRLPVLPLNNSADGQTLSVQVGQLLSLSLQTIGAGNYGDPMVSSEAVRFIDARFVPFPNPAGPLQGYRFVAQAPGRAEIHIPHTGASPPFDLTLDVLPR